MMNRECSRCGLLRCTQNGMQRIISPLGYETYTFSPREVTSSIDACSVAGESPSREQQAKFLHWLELCGWGILATLYREITIEADRPITIEDLNIHKIPLVEHKIEGSSGNERGEKSEERLWQVLTKTELFPWIKTVERTEDSQPGFDFIIHLEPTHPVTKLLKLDKLYVDAKSSFSHVNKYLKDKSNSTKVNAKLTRVLQKGSWPINASEEMPITAIYAQLVTLLILSCGLLNQPAHWKNVLNQLHPDIVSAFEAHQDIFETIRSFIDCTSHGKT